MNGGHFVDTNSFNHLTLIIDKSTVSMDDVVDIQPNEHTMTLI